MAIEKLKGKALKEALATDGMHSDGGGLYINVASGGLARSYVFRWTDRITKRERRMGLGSLDTYDLHQAREKARLIRQQLAEGKDPIAIRDGAKLDAEIAVGRAKTVREVFDEWYDAKISASRLSVPRRKFVAYIGNRHVMAKIGDMSIQRVNTNIILDKVELRSLWKELHPTGKELQSIMQRMFSYAIASKYYVGENPAAWKDNLEHILPASRGVHKVDHRPSLPFRDVGRFVQAVLTYEDRSVRKMGHPTLALWLVWTVLTAVRISEGRLATMKEIDEQNGVWVIPPEHHKVGHLSNEPHIVPITKPMWDILAETKRRNPDWTPDTLIFPSSCGGRGRSWKCQGEGRPFDSHSMARWIHECLKWDETEITPHGFRSTFIDWARANGYAEELREMQVGHLPKGKVAQAYARDQLVNERRPMMEHWGETCSRPAPDSAAAGNVASFADQRAKRRTA